jgi:hypothetical protein
MTHLVNPRREQREGIEKRCPKRHEPCDHEIEKNRKDERASGGHGLSILAIFSLKRATHLLRYMLARCAAAAAAPAPRCLSSDLD